jgi:hypothetical protein
MKHLNYPIKFVKLGVVKHCENRMIVYYALFVRVSSHRVSISMVSKLQEVSLCEMTCEGVRLNFDECERSAMNSKVR